MRFRFPGSVSSSGCKATAIPAAASSRTIQKTGRFQNLVRVTLVPNRHVDVQLARVVYFPQRPKTVVDLPAQAEAGQVARERALPQNVGRTNCGRLRARANSYSRRTFSERIELADQNS